MVCVESVNVLCIIERGVNVKTTNDKPVVRIRKLVQQYQWDSADERKEATEIAEQIIKTISTTKEQFGQIRHDVLIEVATEYEAVQKMGQARKDIPEWLRSRASLELDAWTTFIPAEPSAEITKHMKEIADENNRTIIGGA